MQKLRFIQLRHDMRRIPRAEMPKRSTRRIKSAQKAVQREKDSVALFPELARFRSVEERLDAQDKSEFTRLIARRRAEAEAWLKVRRRLRQLPSDKQARFVEHWNKRTMVPAEGVNACTALFQMFPRPDWYLEDRLSDPRWDTSSGRAMINQAFEEYFGEKFRMEFPEETCQTGQEGMR